MEDFDRLLDIFRTLRAPGGCPWDREQTHESIARCAIEESYELVEAIDAGDNDHMREELGDVLLQVIFHSLIAEDEDAFTLGDVINELGDKLVYRHPHVFGDTSVEDSGEVIRNWERLKRKEETKQDRVSILDGVPAALPALLSARKLQGVARRVGFDWEDPREVLAKIREEAMELDEAMEGGDQAAMEHELGDLLFAVVNLARFLKVDPETALRKTNQRFRNRFHEIEKEAGHRGVPLEDMSLEEMDTVWEQAKKTVG